MKTGGGVNYTYDGDGDRVQKSNGKLYWFGVGTQVLAESDASGNITDEYVYFGGKRIAHRVVSTNAITYYAEDMLGSSRAIGTSTGTICFDADFYPFGGEHDFTNSCPQNYKFTGKERDAETGNDDFDARYYSSAYGRFLSADWSAVPAPVPYANLTNPQTLNLYAMVNDNPETFADLDGHQQYQQSNLQQGPCGDSGTVACGEQQQQQSAQSAAAAQTQAQNQGAGQASGNATFRPGNTTVSFTWTTFSESQGKGVEVEASVKGCDNCVWAQTVSGPDIKGGSKADTQVGADPKQFPFTGGGTHPNDLYDRPERSSAPANVNFVSTVGQADGKNFKAKGSLAWGFSVSKGGDVKFSGVRAASPAEQKSSLTTWKRATDMTASP